MPKKLLIILFILTIFLPLAVHAKDKATFFYGYSCPHCANVEKYFEDNDVEKKIDIEKKEVYKDKANADELNRIFSEKNVPANERGVPALVWGDDIVVGDTPIIDFIKQKLSDGTNTNTGQKIYNLPFFGKVDLMKFSLPALTVVIGLIDGFNPCAMWVLVLLIGALIGMQNRKYMWGFGLTFIGASALFYFMIMAAWLNLFLFIGYLRWIQIIIGLGALLVGAYYLREYKLNRDEACRVVKGEKRKKIIDRINNIVSSKKILYAIGSLVALAIVVNMIELACSLGLPAIYTNVLSLSDIPTWQYYLYILLYIIIFMLDDMIIFTVAMVTVRATGLSGKYSRFSELIGGIIILLIGIILIFKPAWLSFT